MTPYELQSMARAAVADYHRVEKARSDVDTMPDFRPLKLDESSLVDWAARHLETTMRWSSEKCWYRTGSGKRGDAPVGVWVPVDVAWAVERVRVLLDRAARSIMRTSEAEEAKRAAGLLSRSRVANVEALLRGRLWVDGADFDRHPDLLAAGNGVVNLQTGELLPHDPELMLTRWTPVEYRWDAVHEDWDAALEALPADVREWFRIRVGQAATGYMTPDDVLLVLRGSGENGKTTVLSAISRALGQYSRALGHKTLLASAKDHTTELTDLRGARLAFIEELPEGRHLSVQRLKQTVGTPTITARRIAENNTTWESSHSLFVTTNYTPQVSEVDHGTWRRLALVEFPYRFRGAGESLEKAADRAGDGNLRSRLRNSEQSQAVLAWIVAGAREWYSADRIMPPIPLRVQTDTDAWRGESDELSAFLTERCELDPEGAVLWAELYEQFRLHLVARGHAAWSDRTLRARLREHPVGQLLDMEARTRGAISRPSGTTWVPTDRTRVTTGIRFRALETPLQPSWVTP